MVLYLPLPVAGLTIHPSLILIRKSRRGDFALLMHERVHAMQMRRVGWLRFVACYLTDRQFRQSAEVEAYRVQIFHGASLDGCAEALSRLYMLGITKEQARELLR